MYVQVLLAFYKDQDVIQGCRLHKERLNFTKEERHRKGKTWLSVECFCNKNCFLGPSFWQQQQHLNPIQTAIRRGNLSIPYPFGTSEGCYFDPYFLITCGYSSGIPTPFMRKGNIPVRNISLDGELQVLSLVARDCYDKSGFRVNSINSQFTLSKFTVSYTRNKFTVVSCDTIAYISGAVQATSGVLKNYTTGCISLCDKIESVDNGSCSGIGCCQTSIPEGGRDLNAEVRSFDNHSAVFRFNPCGFAFVVEEEAYNFSSLDLTNLRDMVRVPVRGA
jgi:hypothetical protein